MNHFLLLFFSLFLTIVTGCSQKKAPVAEPPSKASNSSAWSYEGLHGKTLRVPLKDSIRSGDPAKVYDIVSTDVSPQIYESLYQFHYYSNPLRIVPLLADGMPQFSKDRLTVTIHLKKGVRFQNDPCFEGGQGRLLKAQDFIFGWKRHFSTKVASEGAWIFEGKVAGLSEFKEKYKDVSTTELRDAPFDGFKALDDSTIQIKLTKPYPQLLDVLAMWLSAPIPFEAVQKYGEDFGMHPVGTGAFKSLLWEPQSRVILTRNENFHDEFFPSDLSPEFAALKPYAGKKLPFVDNIVYRVIHEEQPRWLELIGGNADVVEIPKDNMAIAVDPHNIRQISPELKAKGLKLSIQDGVSFYYVFFNMLDPVLGKNKLLRQAIASAFNREEWIKIYRSGRGTVAQEWNPPGLADRCEKKNYKLSYNVERAKELLAQAGYPQGKGLPTFRIDMRNSESASRQVGELLTKNLAEIGIKVNLLLNTFPSFLDKRSRKDLEIAYGAWLMDYPDVENNLQLFYAPNQAPGPNEANFALSSYDELYKKLTVMMPGPERRKIVCKMEEIIEDEAPVALGFYENFYRMLSKRLLNYHTSEAITGKYKFVDLAE